MTHVVKLFGDSIVAEQTEKGTYRVRKGENMVSPYEYFEIRQLTPKCWALKRANETREDILFDGGVMQFGFQFAYALEKIGRSRKKKSWIAAKLKNGTGVYDDSGNLAAFLPGLVHVAIANDRFLVARLVDGPEPYVKVYTMWGEFLAEGFMSEALQKANEKVQIA